QVFPREDQDARLAGFGAHPSHRFQRGVKGERGQTGRFYQRSKRKIADVHIGSSRRGDADGPFLVTTTSKSGGAARRCGYTRDGIYFGRFRPERASARASARDHLASELSAGGLVKAVRGQ